MAQHRDKLDAYRRPSLQIEPLHRYDSSVTSPRSAATIVSPVVDFSPTASTSRDPEGLDGEGENKEPLVGPQRSASSLKAEKEKRKRSRVTPEQLVHLERYFAMDRSPTAARRKDISDHLGMVERQTQIWFQNRRAKAKVQDGKHHHQRMDSSEFNSDAPPELSASLELELHNLIHEEEPVTIIPCTDLTVGSWRRIATSASKYDLVAYVSESKRCLTWFIQSGGYGFKMEVPFHIVIDTEFSQTSSGAGLAVFVLSQPPNFFLENISSPRPDGSVVRTWKRCSDWTEGRQATSILRHTLVGSADQLARVLQSLHSDPTASNIPVALSPYGQETQAASPMELPSPPLAGLTGAPTYPYPTGGRMKHQLARIDTRPKRPSLSFGSLEAQYLVDADQAPAAPRSAPADAFPSQPFMLPVGPPLPSPSSFETTVYPYQPPAQHGSDMPPYSEAGDLQQQHRPNNPAPPYEEHNSFTSDGPQHHIPTAPEFSRPMESPSLLLSPYEPQPIRRSSYAPHPSSPHILAGMPSIVYGLDVNLHRRPPQ